MSVKSLEYAVLRILDALPDSGSAVREIRADVQRALGVKDETDHAERTTADARDKAAPKSSDPAPDNDPDNADNADNADAQNTQSGETVGASIGAPVDAKS
jgi:hypothetical protein